MPNRLLPPACWSTAKQRIRHSPGFGIAATIMRRNARNASRFCVGPDELPDDLFAQAVTGHPVGTVHGPEYGSFQYARC